MKTSTSLKSSPKWLIATLLILLSCRVAPAQEEARAAWQVTRFDITATLPPAGGERVLAARAVLSVRNVGQGTGRAFTARLNPAAQVKSAAVGDAPATFTTRPEARTQLQQVTVPLAAPVAPGSTFNVAFDYRLPVATNTALAAISPEGSQFLPDSAWYPTPNTRFASRGADTAPMRLMVNAPGGETVVSTGQGSGATFEQKLSAQPFFVAGRWDAVEGSGDARGVTALLPRGASADERKRAEALVALAAAARTYFAGLFGGSADTPVRLVAVNRGGGFDSAGAILVEPAAFRRPQTDALTALLIAESLARVWLGGVAPLRGEGAGVLREGLARHLAIGFIEKQFGAGAAEAERLRERLAYAAIARRDAPLSISTPLEPTYFTSVANKGAMIWRLAERALGRDSFFSVLREQVQAARERELTLPLLRAALSGRGGSAVKSLLDAGLDQPTETDLLVGLPQQRGTSWAAALRNTGPFDVAVTVVGTTDHGERVTTQATIKARDFGEAVFTTSTRLVRAEVDPDKLYPQVNYANDTAPSSPAFEDSLEEAARALGAQDFTHAERVARDLLAAAPSLQDSRILLARALLGANRLADAEREFRAAADLPLPLPSTLAWAGVGLGEIALRRNQPAEAARLFTEAVRAEGGYAPTLAARAARLRIEAQGTSAPAVDEAVRAAVAQLDQAIKSGRRAEIDALVVSGELEKFVKGIIGSQPELWQTKLLRTEALGSDRIAAEVQITARTLGRDLSGPAFLVFSRVTGRLLLAEINVDEVR